MSNSHNQQWLESRAQEYMEKGLSEEEAQKKAMEDLERGNFEE